MKTDVSGVHLARGEEIKATYPINRTHRPLGWAESYVVVTDARILYRAQAANRFNRSAHMSEVHIADVTGVSLGTKRGLTPLAAATFVVVAVLGLFIGIMTAGVALLFVIPLLGLIWWLGSGSMLCMQIHGGATSQPIEVGSGMGVKAIGAFKAIYKLFMNPLLTILKLLGLQHAGDVSLDGMDITGENREAMDNALKMYDEIGALILDIQNSGVLADPRS